MFLYNITLQRATGITHAIHGNFSGEVAHLPSSSLIGQLQLQEHKLFVTAEGCDMSVSLKTAPCLHRNQDAGDCCFQGEDLGITAPRC